MNNPQKHTSKTHENSTSNFESVFIVFIVSSYLLLDFTPVLNSLDVGGNQWLILTLLNLVLGYFTYTFSKTVELTEFKLLKINSLLLLYGIFIFLSGISIFYTPNLSEGILTFIHLGLIFTLVVFLKTFSQTKLNVLLNLSIAISIIAFYQSFTTVTSFLSNVGEVSTDVIYKILTQNAGNINIFSATLLFKIPFILYALQYFKGFKKLFFGVTFGLAAIVLLLALARTSVISFLIITLFFIIINLIKKKEFTNILIIIISLAIAYGMQTRYFKYLPKKGVIEVYMNNSDEDMTSGRIHLWKNTIEIIKDAPLFGKGLGSYKIESIPYESKQRSNWQISKYSHNDFLQTASETGIINGLIYLFIFLFIAWKSLIVILDKTSNESNFWLAIIIFTSVFAYGFDSSLNFPKERIITQIHFALILFLFFVLTKDEKEKYTVNNKIIYSVLGLFCLASLYPNYLNYKSLKGQNEILLDETSLKLSSTKVNELLPSFPTLTTLGYQIDAVKARYLEKEGKFDEALNLIYESKKENKNMMMNESILATIYTKKNMPDSVFKQQKDCYEMYPLYEPFFANHLNQLMKKKDTLQLKNVIKYTKTLNYNPKLLYIATKYLKEANISNSEIKKLYGEELNKYKNDSLINIVSKVLDQKESILPNNIKNDIVTIEIQQKEIQLLNKLKTISPSNWSAQVEIYKELTSLLPNKMINYENIGVCYFQQKKYENAVPYLQKVIESKTFNNGKSEYITGACYHYLKQSDLACKYAKLAIQKNYKDAQEIINKHCK